jgi:hypothetical protein
MALTTHEFDSVLPAYPGVAPGDSGQSESGGRRVRIRHPRPDSNPETG